MKKIVFTGEGCQPENLFPFTLTRRTQDIRVGILTIREKWERCLELPSFDRAEPSGAPFPPGISIEASIGKDIIYLVQGNILPTAALIKLVKKLKPGECLSAPGRESIVSCLSGNELIDAGNVRVKKAVECGADFRALRFPWEIFQFNGWAIGQDFSLLTRGRRSQKVPASNGVTYPRGIFIEKGARVAHSILNATEGPIYIGKDAEVMEGCTIRGPVSIGEGALVKMGARLYGATTIGPHCVAGGEIKNAVLSGYANKAHDGYLGDSVIGEWCNLGAGTSNSNLKNTASAVKAWTPSGLASVGLKCGVLMGDYSRTAINTSINTGTVIGVCSHVFGSILTPKYIPSFSWGSAGVERYVLDKALADIRNWKALKNATLSEAEQLVLKHIFEKM